jgi:ribose 1,5-bisphosphokinase PhnN
MRYILWPALRDDDSQRGREFTPEEITLTYNALYALIDALLDLQADLVVVAEGTYRSKLQRETLKQIAHRHGADFVLVHVRTQEDIQLERLRIRLERREGGGPESYYTTKPEYEEPDGDVLRIENSGDFEALDKSVYNIVQLLVGR